MSLTHDDLQVLKGFFKPDDHEFDYNKNAYITKMAITNRLEEVDPAWSLSEPKIFWREGEKGTHICEVSVVMTVKNASRGAVGQKEVVLNKAGTAEANQAAKSAATDALKRAARLFGVGRYLLDLPNSVKDVNSMATWLNAQQPLDLNQWNKATMTDFWQRWTGAGVNGDDILSTLEVTSLGAWKHSAKSAHERMEIKFNKKVGA